MKDGGPAFPRPESWDGKMLRLKGQDGMSLRDWFATHAPEVPEWFKAPYTDSVMARVTRPRVIDEQLQLPRLREAVQQWRRDPCYDLESIGESEEEKALLRNFQAAFERYAEDCQVAREQLQEERYFAWRWYYADAMLKAREEVPS